MRTTYTVFTSRTYTGKSKKVASGLSVSQAMKMVRESNAPWCEFTTDKIFKASLPRKRSRRSVIE